MLLMGADQTGEDASLVDTPTVVARAEGPKQSRRDCFVATLLAKTLAAKPGMHLGGLMNIKLLLLFSFLNLTPSIGATPEWFVCKSENVVVRRVRIAVRCSNQTNGIHFFASPTDNSDHTTRLLTLMSSARSAGKDLHVQFDRDDTSGVAFGCKSEDCRTILALKF